MYNDIEKAEANDCNRSNIWQGKSLDPSLCTGPKAAVFSLRTYRNHQPPPPTETGQASRRLIFDLLAGLNPELSDDLHDAIKMKPYTASFIEPTEEKGRYTWRVTDCLGGLLPLIHQSAFRQSGPASVNLAGIPATFEGVAVSPSHHPRAASATWPELLDIPTFKRAVVHFLSPTVFRTDGRYFNLMMSPLSVLSTTASKWAFSGEDRFPAEMAVRVAKGTSVRYVKLWTKTCRGVGGRRSPGVMGRVEFCCDLVEPEIQRAFSVLFSYLPWCGVGWGTGCGMGQVRVEAKE
jgi:hypothetical protein